MVRTFLAAIAVGAPVLLHGGDALAQGASGPPITVVVPQILLYEQLGKALDIKAK
jgi:hypothetical protein